jgi:D-alanine--poly(phosphoribitol) ligase subunit 2
MEKIKEIILSIQPGIDFASVSDLIGDGYLDSLDVIRLVSQLDTVYGISIAGADMNPENFKTLESIKKMLEKYLSN